MLYLIGFYTHKKKIQLRKVTKEENKMLFQGTHGFYLDSVPHKFLLFQVIVNLQWLSPATPFKLEKISNIKPRIGLF